MDADLLPVPEAAAAGDLRGDEIATGDRAAVTVVLVGADPLDRGDRGTPIDGVEDAKASGALVFHAGTAERSGRLLTNGRRILNVTGVGVDVAAARAAAYEAVGRISFAGMHYRTDIAANAEARVG